jgi:hypothetical protein
MIMLKNATTAVKIYLLQKSQKIKIYPFLKPENSLEDRDPFYAMKINTKGIQYLNIVRKNEEVLPDIVSAQSNSEDSLKFFKGVMSGVPIALFMWWLIWKVFN